MIRCHRSTPKPISFQSTFLCYHLGYIVIVTGRLLPSSHLDKWQLLIQNKSWTFSDIATEFSLQQLIVHWICVFEVEMILGLFSALGPKSLEYHIIFLQNNLSLMLQWAPSAPSGFLLRGFWVGFPEKTPNRSTVGTFSAITPPFFSRTFVFRGQISIGSLIQQAEFKPQTLGSRVPKDQTNLRFWNKL